MKKINLFAILAMVFAVSTFFVSCDKDDDDVNSNKGKVVKEVAYNDGEDANYKYSYNYSGDKVNEISYYDEDKFVTTADISKIYGKSKESTLSIGFFNIMIKTNEQEYMSSTKWSDGDEDIEAGYKYDSNGFLTKITYQGIDEDEDPYYAAMILTYTNGNLASVKLTYDKDEKEFFRTITFKTSSYENKNGILCPWLEMDIDDGFIFYYAGLLGKPTKNLIASAQIQYADGETKTIEYTYSFNSDGDVTSTTWPSEWSDSECKVTYGY